MPCKDAKGVSGARWIEQAVPSVELIRDIMGAGNCSPLLARLLALRGIAPAEVTGFLNPGFSDIKPPEAFSAMASAVDLIMDAVEQKKQIAIYGDYDVDGITSIAILSKIFSLIGARHQFYIPHRLDEGYGLQCAAVDQLADQGVNLLITVDCGVTATDAVGRAKARGMSVIVTDHHQLSGLPAEADVIIHPQVAADAAVRHLCGAGIALKLAWAVARRFCQSDRVTDAFRAALMESTALAALGTIADVASLTGDNRITVKYGLKALRQISNPGLAALARVANRVGASAAVNDEYIGFSLAPRLNAAGRMGHAREALELLMTLDMHAADALAQQLDKFNRQRQETERKIVDHAEEMVLAMAAVPPCIILFHESWHAGVVGIVASRLVDRFARPVFILRREGNTLSGSARGLPGFDVHAAIEKARPWIISGGGHAAAGGVKLAVDNFEPFSRVIGEYAAEVMPAGGFIKSISVDAMLGAGDISGDLMRDIEKLAPFGAGNPRPKFILAGAVIDAPPHRMGVNGRTLGLRLRTGGRLVEAVGFGLGLAGADLRKGMTLDTVVEFRPAQESRYHRPEFRLLDFSVVSCRSAAESHAAAVTTA
jgi:single-stranded-DNA-specific exonuclease